MKVKIPLDKDFEFERCKKMYRYYNARVNDDSTFEEVLSQTFFYAFYDNDEITLCVYFYEKNNKLWVNGYGIRNKHFFNKKCFESALGWFNCDIWANTKYKDVAWALLRCGFKKVKENIYVFKKDDKKERIKDG